jgi:PAS domain S-box-containing protein
MNPDTPAPAPETRPSNSLPLALIYAAFAGMWILFSDQAMLWLFSDPADYAMASTFKGLLFVVVTTLLLYGLMRRQEAGEAAISVGHGLRWPILLMGMLVAGLTTVVIQRSLGRGEGLGVAAWIGTAGLLTLIALGAVLLILRQRTQLQLAQATRIAQAERLRALKLLAAIADSSEDAIFALDMNGRFVMANRIVQAETGKTQAELLGADECSLFPPEAAARVMADNQWVLTNGVSRSVEETLPLATGERTLLTTKSPLRDPAGEIIGLLGISRDITDRKAAENALRATEQRFHDIVSASADWIWEIDTEHRYTYASESVWDLLGYTPAEILGKTPFDLMPPQEAARVRGLFEDFVARREPFRDLDNITLHKDGSLRHVSTNGIAILAADGELLGYRGLDRDITEKRLAQMALEETGNRLRTLVNTLPDLVWLKDTHGVYLACNHRFEAFFGAREADIVGKTDHDFVPAELADFFRANDQAAIEADGPSSNEEEVAFASDGHREMLHTLKTPIHDGAGRVIGVLGIARDITQRKAAEAALLRLKDDLAATLRAIPDLLFELDETGRYLKVEATAHDLLAAPAEQMLGRTIGDMLPPEATRTIMDALQSAARNGTDYGRTITLPLEAGPRHFELSVARKSMDSGSGQRFIVLSRDITARKMAEDELRRNNEELQRFNRATVGRELDMIELKKQINALARELGRQPPYPLRFLESDNTTK